MLIPFFGLFLVLLLFLPTFPSESYGHRSGCHAAHSCPSDTGSYVCGDTGNFSQCPGNDSNDDEEKSEKKKSNTKSKSNAVKSDPALPSETLSEGIEISGPVTYVVDGDTLDINDIRIRLSLANTPEEGEPGFDTAKEFVENLCLDKNGQVDIDDGQRQGSFGREIGVVYCDGTNLNSVLMQKGYALISTEFCAVSEFANEAWAKSSCLSNTGKENASPIESNNANSQLSSKALTSEIPSSKTQNQDNSDLESEPNEAITSIPAKNEKFVALGKWGSLGISDGQFNSPSSIAFDPSSHAIYVADLENNRIQKFDTNGGFLMKWGLSGSADGEFYHPGDIETDSSGNVYVVDISNARIQKFDSEGNFLMKWGTAGEGDGQFDHPGDITIDESNKEIYVTDIGNNRIQKFDLDGNFLMKWGTAGEGDGQFNRPAGMALDPSDEILYVADTKNDRIQKFDMNGNFLSKWGSSGSGNGDFNRPTGIEFGSTDGIIYVTDNDNKRIQVFDKNGNFLSKWGSDKNFERPTGIAIDELNNKAFVNDKANNNVQVFTIPEDPFANLEYALIENSDNSVDSDEEEDDVDRDEEEDDVDRDEEEDDGGDKDCSDFDKKNFKVQPGDPYDLDRDGDGIACET